ncbi:MAG: ATP-binding protein [Bacteroidales bacterium]
MEIVTTYRKKQFYLLVAVFTICALVIFVSEYLNEKKALKDSLNAELDSYSEIVERLIQNTDTKPVYSDVQFNSILNIFAGKDIRVTIIDNSGIVLYDNRVEDISKMENHSERPEIKMAAIDHFGYDIRTSSTKKVKYYYYAKKFKGYFIRISVEYTLDTAKLVEPRKFPIFLTLLIFFTSTLVIVFVRDKFGKSVLLLKTFTNKVSENQEIDTTIHFPKNELGNIGQDIVEIYDKLNKTKADLISEKEKIIRHLNLLEEGIAIFSKDKTLIANNSNFVQYISLLSDKPVLSPENFFEVEAFSPLFKFIDSNIQNPSQAELKQKVYEININSDSRIYSAKSIVFQDESIEIIISDITRPARRKLIKQQLTENIAHELKTPVSSIKGFLETIIDLQPGKEKLYYFIKKAYSQTCRLADLINDISLLTKIEEAGNLYKIEKVHLSSLLRNVIDDVDLQLKENNIELIVKIPDAIECDGNPILLYSVFRNLFDNCIMYAGKDLTIKVEQYMEDEDFIYFSFSDNGIGVPEQDLSRLFERFYRVEKGRDHKKGGTGLGLAIVKNSILFHQGEISVKNRKEGGLEFLFSFKKILS